MSISSSAKRRAAERHNQQYEANKNRHRVGPLFDYLGLLCRPIERDRGNRVHHISRSSLLTTMMIATAGIAAHE